jgi:[acyl-carrier-protein] S-malonyltransferase
MTVAFVFPGQASQEVGMGVALRQASRRADDLFRLAERVSELPIGDLCANGPLDELTRTNVAQIAVVVTSLAAVAVLEECLGSRPNGTAVAGHSVGELAALCWAGALDEETTLRLVHERGRLMERDSVASDGTMVAVLGLDRVALEAICRDASTATDETVQVANINAPGQIVLSGHRVAIQAASERATAQGARRVVPLNVGGPFHSVYMAPAAGDFRVVVESAAFKTPSTPIVLNTDARPTTDTARLREELPDQITRSVLWEDSLGALRDLGCSIFVELGPGQVLSGLIKRTLPDVKVVAAGTPDAIQNVAALLRDRSVA